MGSLWERNTLRARDLKASERLCKTRDELVENFPKMKMEWERIDADEVLPAAETLGAALHTENGERILAAREVLKKAIWKRDGLKEDYQRKLEELSCEIEILSGPIIAAKCTAWQTDLAALRGQKIVECVERFADMRKEHTPQMVKYRSNFQTIEDAKNTLTAAIRTLREMRSRPLAEIHQYIEATEQKLKKLDFGVLAEAKEPVTETAYASIIEQQETLRRPERGSRGHIVERFFRP